ncbi:MAG TPA: hypothetical protein VN877_02030 [Opitutaceae bacterium]|nr:hypothetical protein [Opitutaceae bacterium]
MTMDRDELRRLHFINALFAHVTGRDLFLAHQIKAAIAFTLDEFEAQAAEGSLPDSSSEESFNAAAARLLDKLYSRLPRHGFFHWDASRSLHSGTPLFARAEVMAGLRQLAPFRESTLLITNLRPAVLPPERRETTRRRREYDDLLGFLRELTAARSPAGSDLTLLFL